MKKKLVVLTGAGISAESGIKTFRDAGGLWEGHNVMDVASPQGWHKDRALVLNFYNERRRALKTVVPNAAHYILVELEQYFDVQIITQNVDDLHERAGSSNILHLHGQLLQSKSSVDDSLVYDCTDDIKLGDKCEKGSQIRPNIVWFGEAVPLFEDAIDIASTADIMAIIGTSLVVYPAAGLVQYAPSGIPTYVIDPNQPAVNYRSNVKYIAETATVGTQKLKELLLEQLG
jgi:NAD-dependent deacetylase